MTLKNHRFKMKNMKAEIKIEKTVNAKTLVVNARVRYWEDATINGIDDTYGTLTPCRTGEMWCPVIDIDNGVIANWQKGVIANIHFKVCDEGNYQIKDETGEIITSIKDCYVPSTLCPKENGFGDYIIMDIDGEGKIDGFLFNIDEFLNKD